MSEHLPDVDPTDPHLEGMGVSSERVGPTGDGHEPRTTGTRDTGPDLPDADAVPEQSRGGDEPQPDEPTPPVAGYPARDPRHADAPYDAPPDV